MNKEMPFCLSINTQDNTFLLHCNLVFCYHMSHYNNQTYICGKARNHSEAVLTTTPSFKDGFLPKCIWAINLPCTASTKQQAQSQPHRRPWALKGERTARGTGADGTKSDSKLLCLGWYSRHPNTSTTIRGGSVQHRQRKGCKLRITMKWLKV